jgi:hypothetical protein
VYLMGLCCQGTNFNAVLFDFDASGASGRSEAPVTCQAQRTAPLGSAAPRPPVAVAGSTVYAAMSDGVQAFDAASLTRRWRTSRGAATSATIANGVLYVMRFFVVADDPTFEGFDLEAYDATGTAGCSGAPLGCEPLLSVAVGIGDGADVSSGLISTLKAPAVAGGRVYTFDLGIVGFGLPPSSSRWPGSPDARWLRAPRRRCRWVQPPLPGRTR